MKEGTDGFSVPFFILTNNTLRRFVALSHINYYSPNTEAMITPENNNEEEATRKTIYKETDTPINEKEADNGDTSSVADLDRTDFTRKPTRANKPMGSSHEPGTL